MANNKFTVFGITKEIYKDNSPVRKVLYDEGLLPDTTAKSNDMNTALKELSLVTVSVLEWIKGDTTKDFTTPDIDTDPNNPVNTRAFITNVTDSLSRKVLTITNVKEFTINSGNPLHGKIYEGTGTLKSIIDGINTNITTANNNIASLGTSKENVINAGNPLQGKLYNTTTTLKATIDGLISDIATANTRITSLDNSKAGKATTLAGYGITDAYTKAQANTEIGKKENTINTLNPLHGKIYEGTGTLKSIIDGINTNIASKEPSLGAGTVGQYYRGDKSWQVLNKNAVGLYNVEDKSSSTIRSEITKANVTTALGYTPSRVKLLNGNYIQDVTLKAGDNVSIVEATGVLTISSENTTYGADKGITLTSSKFGHSNNITAGNTGNTSNSPGFGGTFSVPYLSYDEHGHITGKELRTITLPSAPTVGGGKLTLNTTADSTITDPIAINISTFTANSTSDVTYTIKFASFLQELVVFMNASGSGFLRKNGANQLLVDTSTYSTAQFSRSGTDLTITR